MKARNANRRRLLGDDGDSTQVMAISYWSLYRITPIVDSQLVNNRPRNQFMRRSKLSILRSTASNRAAVFLSEFSSRAAVFFSKLFIWAAVFFSESLIFCSTVSNRALVFFSAFSNRAVVVFFGAVKLGR